MTEPSEFLYIVNLNYAGDVEIENGIEEPSWEEFRDSLISHDHRRRKDGRAFIPVMMKPESEWVILKSPKTGVEHHRGDDNVEAITALVIDIDKPGALEAAEALFEGYEYVVYSTHNYTAETPWKFRLVARLADPIPIAHWKDCFEALKSRIEIDPSCCNPSRCYYYPSHSMDSQIKPKAFYRTGKAMTMDAIIKMADMQKVAATKHGLRANPLGMRTMGTRPISEVRASRHFSGNMVGHYERKASVMSTSMKDMEERHQKSLYDYSVDDSRHNLALSITSREYAIFGPKVDLRALLVFIFKAANRGSKPLEAGNTPQELPDMIASAMLKYAPEAEEQARQQHGDKVYSWIIGEVDWALNNYENFEVLQEAQRRDSESSIYQVYRRRHTPFLKEYVATGDLSKLTQRVMAMELGKDDGNYSELAQTIIKYAKGYYANVKGVSEDIAIDKIKNAVNLVAKEIKEPTQVTAFLPDKSRKYMSSAMIVEMAKLIKKIKQFEAPASSSLSFG